MRIFVEGTALPGVPLQQVEHGTVVRLALHDTLYMVAHPMDGSSRRVLVTLESGTIKDPEQTFAGGDNVSVVKLDATLIVHGTGKSRDPEAAGREAYLRAALERVRHELTVGHSAMAQFVVQEALAGRALSNCGSCELSTVMMSKKK